MSITWHDPAWLFGLWLLAPLGLLCWRAHRRRRRAAARFADPAMAPRLMPFASGARPWVRDGLLLLGVAALVLGLARPQWGVRFRAVAREGADLMVLLDVSRSMLSKDVRPSRLERAKSDVKDLLGKIRGDRVGLVAFAGRAVVACPLTTDFGFFAAVLDDAGPHTAPRGGTAIGDAIRKALKSLDREDGDRDRALLLITDGEDHESFPREAAALAAGRGVKIFAVGMGDPVEGARVPVRDAEGGLVFLKHEGAEVWSKMDEGLLRTIALETGGAYVPARTRHYDLGQVYETHLSKLAAGRYDEARRKRRFERFQVFVALGLALILVHLVVRPYGRNALAVLLLAVCARAGEREAFNEGVKLAAAGQADDARTKYLDAAGAADAALAARARYNLGTLAAEAAREAFGEDPVATPKRREGLDQLERALGHYRACLELAPDHEDARFNLELIKRWLAWMRPQWEARDKEQREQQEQPQLLQFLEALMERVTAREPDLQGEIATLDGHIDAEVPEQARAALKEWSAKAADALGRDAFDEAHAALDRIWAAVAPFDHVLKTAIRRQEEAIETPAVDGQARVGRLAVLLALKAQQGLEAPDQPQAHTDPLKEAYEKAIAVTPGIGAEVAAAIPKLEAEDADGARPHQDEALRLLNEIADELPEQDQQQQEQQQEEQQQEQDTQEEQREPQPRPEDNTPSPEQIESLLRKAQEREREHKENKRKAAAVAAGKVDRDW